MGSRLVQLKLALTGMFGRSFAKLPIDLQRRVERAFLIHWDSLAPEQRKIAAECWDANHPIRLTDKEEAKIGFREGFKKVSIPLRNKLNAKHPRPGAQKVSDADILRVKRALQTEGVPRHKQCTEAYQRLGAGRIALRSFRDRWNRHDLDKKKGG
jgi:hypothetical protein